MMSLREKKIAKKKQDILRSAATVLAEKGFQGTTMEEVAANLLMTKGSMYYYFKNKDDLLFQCHQMVMDLSLEKIEQVVNSDKDPIKKLEQAVESHILLATSEKSMFLMMDQPNQNFSGEHLEEALQQRKDYAHHFDDILQEGIEKGVFDETIDIRMVRFIILGALNWTLQWYSEDGPQTAEEIANSYAKHLLKMVVKDQ
ncbi:TetR family transcriptional regulator [Pontibacillus yanchengensis]|uniref:TetR family transcriptional regulator n=1 Tax=Pontibacillus yanchengensis TaxID=462910 RepID=A0ACC7VL32_9BACI|nr:TetR family transcriptional regulator [Pontibacillus yanchengensis]